MSSELALSYDERLVYPDEELFEEDFEGLAQSIDGLREAIYSSCRAFSVGWATGLELGARIVGCLHTRFPTTQPRFR